jgi:hypothetical protein
MALSFAPAALHPRFDVRGFVLAAWHRLSRSLSGSEQMTRINDKPSGQQRDSDDANDRSRSCGGQ